MSKLRYANPSLIFKIGHRVATIFFKEGPYDVKWDQLICQKPQLHSSKICIPYRSSARFSSSVTLIYARRYIRKTARSVDVLQRAAKP
jgi:hypothetical protein